MIDSGEMVGELVGGNVAVLWAMAEVFSAGRRSKNGVPNRAEAGGAPAPHLLGSGGERWVSKTWGDSDELGGTAIGMTLWWMEVRGCGGCRSSQRNGQARMAVTASMPAGTPWSLIDRMRLMR
jgi:hypothetical protein